MGKPRCYLAGPIRQTDDYEVRFDSAKAALERKGWEVWSPMDWIRQTGQVPGQDLDDRQGMADDIVALVKCDAIFMLHGWKQSRGARAELAVAEALNINVFHQSVGVPRA